MVTNPVANLKLAVGGIFPYPAARERGVSMGVGTDGPGSNNSLDLLSDLKTFALLQKNAAFDAAAIDAGETLRLGRGDMSDLLRSAGAWGGGSGGLSPGARGLAGVGARRAGRRPRLRGVGLDRRHDGRRGPPAHARGEVDDVARSDGRAKECASEIGVR